MSASHLSDTSDQPAIIVKALRPLAVAGMLTCIAVSLAQVIRGLNPDWPGSVFVWLVFIISLESVHSYHVLMSRGVADRDRGRFRFVEWVVILLLLRLAFYVGRPAGSLMADIWAWSDKPQSFFDLEYVVLSILMAAFWIAALVMARALAELDMAKDELHEAENRVDGYLWQTMPRHGQHDRSALLAQINAMFLAGGVIVIILAGLARINLREAISLTHGRTSGIILNVLLYFALGLLLISQSQYAASRARWDLASLPIWDEVGRRWMVAAIALLLLVGGLAALLPVGYSVGLMQTLGVIVSWIWYILVQIVAALVFIVSLIIGLITNLFTGEAVDASFSMGAPPELPAEASAPAGSGLAWWPWLRSLLFWAVLIGVVGYSVVIFLRDRWGLFRGEWLQAWLQRLRALFGRARGDASEAWHRLQAGILQWRADRRDGKDAQTAGFLSLSRLNSRERVRYFYLSTLRRAERAGLQRKPSQTPAEFETVLATETPEPDSALALTEAFHLARYSAADMTRAKEQDARGAWRRLKRVLQRRVRRN